jgi:hypothetical protein
MANGGTLIDERQKMVGYRMTEVRGQPSSTQGLRVGERSVGGRQEPEAARPKPQAAPRQTAVPC